MSEELRQKEDVRMKSYLSKLDAALKTGTIKRLDFVFPKQILEEVIGSKEFRKFRQNLEEQGDQLTRIYHDYLIFCFGRLYEILDFEDFKTKRDYPDAEAMRDGKRIRIEFEVLGSEFDHEDASTSDLLIVCMVNDKKDIPIEVLELKPLLRAIQFFS